MDDRLRPRRRLRNAGGRGRLGKLRALMKCELKEIKAGRAGNVEEAFTRIEAMLDELEAAKRS